MHLCNDCHHGKALSITYSECTSVALVIQHAKRMSYYIVICGLSGSDKFFHVISERHEFLGGGVVEHKV